MATREEVEEFRGSARRVASLGGVYADATAQGVIADRRRWDALREARRDPPADGLAAADAAVAGSGAASAEAFGALGSALVAMHSAAITARRRGPEEGRPRRRGVRWSRSARSSSGSA